MTTATQETRFTLATIFERLFENEFATLDGIAISCRTGAGMDYVDGTAALSLWLDDQVTGLPPEPEDAEARAMHEALLTALPEHEAVISGWSRHLRALLLEGLGLPPSTSMMRNRGVPDLSVHIVKPEQLAGPALATTIEQAAATAVQNGMRHVLMVTTEGLVAVSGSPPFEAMAHWHNVEFAARIECMRLDEASVSGKEV